MLLLLAVSGCKRGDGETPGSADGATTAALEAVSDDASMGAKSAPVRGGALGPDGCLAEPDYLIPPTAYPDRDMIRAIVVDGPDAYVANFKDVSKVPLSGGAPVIIGKTPGMTLSGRITLWADEKRLLTQSSAEPIFMELPKAGGHWNTFIDLTPGKAGGGRDAATRILQGMAAGPQRVRAGWADFDGTTFYWTESPARRDVVGKGVVRSVGVSGGEAKTLFEAPGTVDGLMRAGTRLVFVHTEPPKPEQLSAYQAAKKAKKYGPEPKGKSSLLSVPLAGGEATRLLGMAQWMSRAVLTTDGETVYVSGYLDEDLQKPGVYRVEAGGGPIQALDPRVVTGEGARYSGGVAFAGSGFVAKGQLRTGVVVLAAPRGATEAVQVACLSNRFTMHAVAASGSTLLLSVLDGQSGLASVMRLALP